MRAVVVHRFGPPSVLEVEAVPEPIVGAGQVLIRVEVASIVLVETQIRAGGGPSPAHRPELPYIPGNGVGGVVVAVGPGVDGPVADSPAVGSRVVSTTGGRGGYAELVAVPADEPIPVPEGLDLFAATALLADGRTAVGLTRAARPAIGEWVLVEAAGGGVGSLLVQLAGNAGARVVGAASTLEKRELAAALGATITVDYTEPGWPDAVREATGEAGLDLVFDGVGGDIGRAALDLVRDGGRFMVHGMASGSFTEPPPDEVQRRHLEILGLGSGPETPPRELSRLALEQAASGRIRPTIGQTYPLEGASAAHAAIEARATLGKTLLVP
jgi:NADPH2:quinone reductase